MASLVTYTGASGLAENHGKTVKDINLEYTRIGTTLPANLDAVCDVYEGASAVDNRRDLSCMVASHYRQAQLESLSGIHRLGQVIDKRLLDHPSVLTLLSVSDPDVWKAMQAVIYDLYGNHTVNGSVFAIGSITAGSANVGNGSVAPDLLLDAVSAPCQRLRSHARYFKVPSEMVCVETMKVTCVVDSSGQILEGFRGNQYGRLLEPNDKIGNELFCITGRAPGSNRISSNPLYGVGYGLTPDGSGKGPVFYPVDADLSTSESTIISNSGFEDFATTNEPDDWMGLSTGATTTNVLKSTSEKFFGDSSLQFLGSGAATINRGQFVSPSRLIAGKKYYLSIWIKVETGVAAGTVLAQFVGTSYTAAASEKITFAASGAAGGGWIHYGAHICMPLILPSDWLLKVEVNSTLTTGKSVFFDHVKLQEEPWHGGLSCPVWNGSTAPAVGDYWTFPITATGTPGVAQEFNKRWWGVQWPSNLAAGEDILDSYYT